MIVKDTGNGQAETLGSFILLSKVITGPHHTGIILPEVDVGVVYLAQAESQVQNILWVLLELSIMAHPISITLAEAVSDLAGGCLGFPGKLGLVLLHQPGRWP